MRKLILLGIFFLNGLCAITAKGNQIVTIDGSLVNKSVTNITFSGDNVVLTYDDKSTQEADMSKVNIVFSKVVTSISSITDNAGLNAKESSQGVFDLCGRYYGKSSEGLKSGLYIVNGKKVIIK